jgi:hypothetical protein
MKNQLFHLKDSGMKEVMAILDDRILFGTSAKNAEELVERSKQPSFWKGGVTMVLFEEIKALQIEDGEGAFTVKYRNNEGSNKSITVGMADKDLPFAICEYLKGIMGLTVNSTETSVLHKIWDYVLGVVSAPVLGWLLYKDAIIYSQTGVIESHGSGKQRILEALAMKLSDIITPTGILVLGFLIAIAFAWKIKTAYRSSKKKYTFVKP